MSGRYPTIRSCFAGLFNSPLNLLRLRRKLGEVTRVKVPTVTDSYFVFVRAIRRKLSIPVTCDSFAYKQLKVVAGQGAIYVKLKPGFECLLENNDSSDDGKP